MLPNDYEACSECGYDHGYEQDAARWTHLRIEREAALARVRELEAEREADLKRLDGMNEAWSSAVLRCDAVERRAEALREALEEALVFRTPHNATWYADQLTGVMRIVRKALAADTDTGPGASTGGEGTR